MATANATVMFTDIRGFTARTSRGSREGLEELLQTHEALLLPVIQHYDGRVVKTIGDAFLVVFESPTNAVHCGVLIQRRLLEFNQSAPEDKRIEIRIAVNSGEVTLRGDDIFGEPVNICARIEGITEPGEIYFTEATYLTMQKAEVPSSEVGSRRLKGIPEEIKLYRVIQEEDNQLYRAIVADAVAAGAGSGAGDDAETVVGSLSVPQWPPPRGRLKGPRASLVPLVVAALLVALVIVGYLMFESYREAHRYDEAHAALEAEDWEGAQRLAGELWAERGDDQEAIRVLTEGIARELDRLVAKGDRQALADTWAARKLAWGNLPALAELERRVSLAKLEMQIEGGDALGALDALHQLHETDKADGAAQRLLVAALERILVADAASVRDQKSLDAWQERFRTYSERYANLPGFAAVRADAAYDMGMALTAAKNNFWKDAGIQLFRAFLQERPDDRERSFRVRVRLVALRRWHGDPAQLAPYLEEDPARAEQPGVKEAVLGFLSSSYDSEDSEDVAARALLWKYWGKAVENTLHAWIESENEKERLNAFRILGDAGRLGDAEKDKVLAWVLLQQGRDHEPEIELALDHWGDLLRRDGAAARARAAATVPDPLTAVGALRRGGDPLRSRETSDTEWRTIVEACFYDPVEEVLLAAAASAPAASERVAARKILERHGALTDAVASASHLTSLSQWNREAPSWIPPDVSEALAYFTSAEADGVHERPAVVEALRETSAIAADKIAALDLRASLSGSEKRRTVKRWRALQAEAKAALARLEE